ncbi:serralysin [Gammaproteobacteria bacterium]
MDGGTGTDTMIGRIGDDTYIVDNIGDVVTELPGGGFDSVQSSVTYTLLTNVENLVLTGTATINGTGNDAANRIVGNSVNNVLNGKGGSDDLVGGMGNDIYVVDVGTDRVTEQPNQGTDTVRSYVSYTLGINIENLTLIGMDSINATGNERNNTLTGNTMSNRLDGGLGADTMVGKEGDDIYLFDNAADTVTENLGEGIDTICSSINISPLAANVENLYALGDAALNLTGNTLDNVIVGNSANNILAGGVGSDVLDGGTGVDTMLGGVDDDTYVVDIASDVVTENINEGLDTVLSSIAYALGTNIENLVLTGTDVINGTGNELDNVLNGNSAANVLTGGGGNDILNGSTGADTLNGGIGNDTYFVDDSTDIVIENSNEGTDTVQSSITYTLGVTLENLALTGIAAINGTGNTLANTIRGNVGDNLLVGGDGNDTLDGGMGADTLNGGTGVDTLSGGTDNDIYVVDNSGDVVIENPGEGTDVVRSSITYTLGANIENLTLTGSINNNGTGNTLNNTITGNQANNLLNGGNGDDTLNGGLGTDILTGGAGSDIFRFGSALGSSNIDTISDFVSGQDNLYLDDVTFTNIGVTGHFNSADDRFYGSAAGVSHDATDRIIYDTDSGALFYDADGSGAGAAIQFAILTGHPTLSAIDIWVV